MEKNERIGLTIKRISNLFKREVDKAIADRGIEELTGMQSFVIGYLARNSQRDVFQKDIEKEFSIRRSTATAMLQLLEKNGYITRVVDSDDARLKKIILTPKALKRRKIISQEIDKTEERLYRGLSKEEILAFFKVAEKLKENLGG
jgi:DNA-binding MarR family transcriptional regulator